MISTRKWALVLFLALSCLRYSNAQDATGNLSNPWQWQNAGQIGAPITCMAPGQPGYCGPGPSVGGFGDPAAINFSYGLTDLHQNVNIASSLPYQGSGLIVTGFVYGFTAKNGNGWDDGRTDVLSAYVNIYGPGNSIRESYNYNLNYKFDWTSFSYNETFASPYKTNQISTARFGFVGMDNNFWAGFYGPEVINVSFSLKYQADPCVTNPLSSPSCPGFSSALASRTTAPAVVAETPLTTTANITASSTLTATPAPAPTPAPTAASPALISPRLQNIIKSVNEATTATVAATVQQSVQGSMAAQEAADRQVVQQREESQQMATGSLMPGLTRSATETAAESPAAGFTRPGDPAVAARGLSPVMPAEPTIETRAQSKNIQPPAELAGGPSVVAFQTTVDITAYTNVILRDAAFYAPREIYRGQQTVDNRAALRGLGSDARHQEMVDQQYRR